MHLLVGVDKFTKWVEAKPINKLDGKTATKFIIEITTRFGIPHNIITDNGTNFVVGELSKFCSRSKIRLDVASMADTHKYRGSLKSSLGSITLNL